MQQWHDCVSMNLRHLRAFATIADAGSFGRAADRLFLSQPALSRQIQALEAEIGMPLFDRTGRQARLTAEGEDLLRHGRRLLADLDALADRARALRGGEAGILRVGATPQVIENLLAGFLLRYRQCCPNVEVHLVEDGGARLPSRLEQGDVHLAIMPAVDTALPGRLLYPMHLMAVAAATHPLRNLGPLDITALADHALLLLHRAFASRLWFEEACHHAHLRPQVLLESAAPHTLIALAAASYGVAIVPSPVSIQQPGIWARPLVSRDASIGRWTSIAWHPERFLAPYAERFVDEIVAHVEHRFPGHDLIDSAPPLETPKIGGRRGSTS